MVRRLFSFIFLAFGFQMAFSQNVYKDYTDGKVYVKFKKAAIKPLAFENPFNIPLTKLDYLNKFITKYGVKKITKPFYQAGDDEVLPDILKIEFTSTYRVEDFIKELNELAEVEYSEKVPLLLTHAVPNDPLFATAGGSVHLNQIGAQNAWNVFNGGSNITVAIVDNAVMWTHVDLVANTYTNTGEIPGNNIDDDGNGYKDDVNGWDAADNDNNAVPTNSLMSHGTHCAGIAGARTDNNTGVASIGWNIKIIPVKAETNGGPTNNVSAGYEGIIYSVKAKARIISCSWGSTGSSITEQAVITYAWQRGCILFASAGNSNNSTPNYPGAYTNVFCVAAVNPGDVKSSYSNFGNWVDISAPGDNILSTYPYTTTPVYQQISGTSMATPLVAGLAGLMLSKYPHMTRANVLNCLSSTASNIYLLGGNAAFVAGSQLGAGRIDAFQAMNCAASFTSSPPVANFYSFPKNTCPNTLISFFDSSLYQPTTWSWVFQGGSPAVSSSSNPSVQWTAPGTYSVSLTVTNANGSNSITKLSYVTVAGPVSLPFSEGFQTLPFLPANWTPNNIMMDNIYWERRTGVGGFGTSTACAVFDNFTYFVPGEFDEMRTPKYSFSNVATVKLRFDVAYAQYNPTFSDTLEVKMSTNCGATWTSIYLKGGSTLATAPNTVSQFIPNAGQWRKDSIDVSATAAGQGNVMFSFINKGHYGQGIYLDNINLFFPTPTLNITLPSSVCVNAVITPTNASAGVGAYAWNLGGAAGATNIAVPTFSYATAGNYSVTTTAVNGTSSVSLTQTLTVVALPTLTLTTSSSSVCSGLTATITASGATSYSWSNGLTTASILVSPSVTTVYTVTGTSAGCQSDNTFTLSVVPTPTVSANSQTICPGGSATLSASGATSYSWNTGATSSVIVVSPGANTNYTVTGNNSGCLDTKTVSVQIGPSLSILLNGPPSICAGGSATITASGANTYSWSTGANSSSIVVSPSVATSYSVLGASGTCTGNAVTSISISPVPTVNIVSSQAGSLCIGSSATLNASGANTYSWNTGATGNQIVVSPSVNTSYNVTGFNGGCSSTQSISVSVGGNSLNLILSASSPTICSGGTVSINATGANSYSWNNGANSSSIVVSPSLTTTYSLTGINGGCNGNAAITISVTPSPPLSISVNPSATVCLGNSATITASGSYSSFVWTNPVTNGASVVFTPTANTAYTVNASGNVSGCSNSATVLLSIVSNPVSVLSVTNPYCSNPCSGLVNALTTNGTAPYTYSLSATSCTSLPCSNLCQGLYTLYTLDNFGCTASNIFSIACMEDTGIDSFKNEDGVSVYPNPARDIVLIKSLVPNFDFTLYNSIGQIIRHEKSSSGFVELKTSELARGIYLLEIKTGKQTIRKKLVLE